MPGASKPPAMPTCLSSSNFQPLDRPSVRVRPSVRPSLARLVKSRGFGVVRPFVLRGPLSLCRCMILSPFQSGSHAMSSSGDATVDGRPNWKCGFTPLFALVSSLALVYVVWGADDNKCNAMHDVANLELLQKRGRKRGRQYVIRKCRIK